MKFKTRHTVFYSCRDKEGKQHSEFRHFDTELEANRFVLDLFSDKAIELLIVQQDSQKEWLMV